MALSKAETVEATIRSIPGFAEPVSCLTHLVGAVVFLVLGFVLLRRGHGHWGRTAGLGAFAFGCVFLLSMSGVYHMLPPDGTAKEVMRRLDHAAIFVLIAGTFTAIHAILFVGPWRWGMILVIWTLAATAITLKTVFFHSVPEWLSLSMYLGMGWIGLVSGLKLHGRFGLAFVRLMLYGGLAYSAGAILEFLKWPVPIKGVLGSHELFHLAVLAGLLFHWRFIYTFADGRVMDLSMPVRIPESKPKTANG